MEQEIQDLIPMKATWVNRAVEKFQPKTNLICLRCILQKILAIFLNSSDGSVLSYDYMILATGMQLRFDMVSQFLYF